VIGKRDASGIKGVDLTEDHKPDLEKEKKRIERMGGVVQPGGEDGLSASVWLPDMSGGLAMSRSFGDTEFHRVGVSTEPAVKTVEIGHFDQFLIIASDGIWEMLNSDQAARIVERHNNATEACVELIHAATKRWQELEGAYRDDITVIVAFLGPLKAFLEGGVTDLTHPA